MSEIIDVVEPSVPGPQGKSGTIKSATGKTLPAGQQVTVELGGTPEERTIEFGIPEGEQGTPATITSATAETLPPQSAATVTVGGTPSARTFAFGIPKGDPGDGSVNSVNGDLGPDIVLDAGDVGAERRLSFNVLDYGAVADGITDDWAAFQDAVDAAGDAGGGRVVIPAGRYNIDSYVTLRSNVTIDGYGAVLVKRPGRSSYAFFAALSGTLKGYGSSVQNVTMRGISFRGDFANGVTVCAMALHHATNVLAYDCTFIEAQGGGHIFDLNGCDNVTIRDSVFSGFRTDGASLHAEAIQVDVSSAGGISVLDNAASYDALPTINVTVENNLFLPLTIGGVTYPAPVPLGAHSASEGKPFKGIVFRGNRVLGQVDNLTSGHAGAVHFRSIDGLIIDGNEFVNPDGYKAIAIGLRNATSGVNAGNAATSSEPIAPQGCHNVTITNNRFIGFDTPDTSYPVIFIQDNTDAVIKKNFNISGNFYESTTLSGGQTFCRARSMYGIIFSQNVLINAIRGFQLQNSQGGALDGNAMTGAGPQAFFLAGCEGVSVGSLSVDRFYGPAVQIDGSSTVNIAGASIRNQINGDNGIRINDCPSFVVSNVVATAGGGHAPVSAISVGGASSKGVAVGNASRGYTNAVLAGGGATVESFANQNL